MPRLEYRLLDEPRDYPVLFYYSDIDNVEIAARFACDKFIKEGVIYEKTSCAVELACFVIYLQECGRSEQAGDFPAPKGVRLELRQDGDSPSPGAIITSLDFGIGNEVVLHLQADYFYWLGEEWLKSQTVIDEDRKVYVCYAKPSP